MKKVKLRLPFGGIVFAVRGSEKDRSVMAMIEKSRGFYEPGVMRFLREVVRPDHTVLDVGANIGAVSLALSCLAGRGIVYAFEPSRFNYEYLLINLRENGISNVIPVNLGVSDSNTETSFSYVEEFAAGSFMSDTGIKAGRTETVRLTTIDDWVEQNEIARVDLIKMDIEGAESRALKGASRTIRRMRPSLLIECNPIVMRRLFHVDPAEFYSLLSTLFPHIFVIGGRGDIRIEVRRYQTLSDMLGNGRGLEDLFCTFDPKPVAHLIRGRWRCNLREKALSVLKSGQKLFGPGQDNVIVISPSHRITSDVPRIEVERGKEIHLRIRLVNTGEKVYSSDYLNPIHVAYHWLDESRQCVVFDGVRTRLPEDLPPRREIEFDARVVAPESPGSFLLQLSLVQEGIAWFCELDDRLSLYLPACVV